MTTENDTILSDLKSILEEEANFYKNIYEPKHTDQENKTFVSFFESERLIPLTDFEADQCEGLLSLEECAKAISGFQSDKHLDPTALPPSFIVVLGTYLEK